MSYTVYSSTKDYRRRKFEDGEYKFFYALNKDDNLYVMRAINGRRVRDRLDESIKCGNEYICLFKRIPDSYVWDNPITGERLNAKQVEDYLINFWIYTHDIHCFKDGRPSNKRYKFKSLGDLMSHFDEYKYWSAL